MENANLDLNLYWALIKLMFHVKHQLMKVVERYDLSVMQMYTLCSMESDVPIPMNYISNWLVCDASNVTGIVDRLLAQGYISREENPKDRRVKMITLTPKGESLKQKILAELPAHEAGLFDKLTSEQRAQLYTLLTALDPNPAAKQ